MLVLTRKIVIDWHSGMPIPSHRHWPRNRLRRLSNYASRALVHGVVASLLLSLTPSIAPAYATEIKAQQEQKGSVSRTRGESMRRTRKLLGLSADQIHYTAQRSSLRGSMRHAVFHPSPAQPPSGRATEPNGATANEPDGEVISRGIASWYSADRFNRRTCSGSLYDENAMTAAHPWLPLGTRVRVTVEGTHESVVVIINDRQGSKTRVIDLSKGAARELGILAAVLHA